MHAPYLDLAFREKIIALCSEHMAWESNTAFSLAGNHSNEVGKMGALRDEQAVAIRLT